MPPRSSKSNKTLMIAHAHQKMFGKFNIIWKFLTIIHGECTKKKRKLAVSVKFKVLKS